MDRQSWESAKLQPNRNDVGTLRKGFDTKSLIRTLRDS